MTREPLAGSGQDDAIGPSLADFEAGNIAPGSFDHRAHVYVAWCYLGRWPLADAINRFTRALCRYTEQIGRSDKYHETISWFFMIQIANRRRGTAATSWSMFCEQNPDLLNEGGRLLRSHYSELLLNSQHAKEQFVLPDLAGPRSGYTALPTESPYQSVLI